MNENYYAALEQMRRERTTAIAADRSWLTLAGLYWLQPGENRFGAATTNEIVLPAGATPIPATAGSFCLVDGTITLQAHSEVPIQANGEPVTSQELRHDMAGGPDLVTLGTFTMIVIKRGERYGIRLYDDSSPRRQAFTDLDWFPIDSAYRIAAQFVAYEPAKLITYGNVLGDLVEEESPGYIEFGWNDTVCRLDALPRGNQLFFNFRDETNGDTTYGAGRFLYTDDPADGMVVVDFNRATNPYCAYTDYATCPLPPVQNRLPIRVEAGERKFQL